jgi:hypothetical protein
MQDSLVLVTSSSYAHTHLRPTASARSCAHDIKCVELAYQRTRSHYLHRHTSRYSSFAYTYTQSYTRLHPHLHITQSYTVKHTLIHVYSHSASHSATWLLTDAHGSACTRIPPKVHILLAVGVLWRVRGNWRAMCATMHMKADMRTHACKSYDPLDPAYFTYAHYICSFIQIVQTFLS